MKRFLAVLLVLVCLLPLVACTQGEPLPEKSAEELIVCAKEKMQTYRSYELKGKSTCVRRVGAHILQQTETVQELTADSEGNRYMYDSEHTKNADSVTERRSEITVIGGIAYVSTTAEDGTVSQYRTTPDEVTAYSMDDLLSVVFAADLEGATVKAGPSSWRIKIPTTLLSADMDGFIGKGVSVSGTYTTIVIDASYTVKSITTGYDAMSGEMSDAVRMSCSFSRLGYATVKPPADADAYIQIHN